MKIYKILLLYFLILNCQTFSQELRGVWVTRDVINSKTNIAQVMDSLANNNFNVVYFNVWSRGYPLWKSEVFFNESGIYTEPQYGDRDILAEAITEAHRRGLEIEAWFEYGFVSWWSGNNVSAYPKGYLLAKHPDWANKSSSGSDAFPSGHAGDFYWMSHTNPEVQNFLIKLCLEIVDKYDIDGIELDRIRYPSLDCGYDDYTLNLYKTETGITNPVPNNDKWMRWRADKLNEFMKKAYDSVKAHSRNVEFTNAPSHYASGNTYPAYSSYLQDWVDWINKDYLDAAQVQMYVDVNTLNGYIESIFNYRVTDKTKQVKIYPGIAVKPNTTSFPENDVLNMVKLIRSKGLKGNSFWYYSDLHPYFNALKQNVYQEKTYPPYRIKGWRPEGKIIDEQIQTRSNGWIKLPYPLSYGKTSFYATASSIEWIEYFADVPYTAWYDIFAYQVVSFNRTSKAPYQVFYENMNSSKISIDQSNVLNEGWIKIGEAYYSQGMHKIVRLSNEGIESDKWVSADAIMLLLNRKKSPDVITKIKEGSKKSDYGSFYLYPNYPNPFNPTTKIRYQIPKDGYISVKIFDSLGRIVRNIFDGYENSGIHEMVINSDGLNSGIYYCNLTFENNKMNRKILLLK